MPHSHKDEGSGSARPAQVLAQSSTWVVDLANPAAVARYLTEQPELQRGAAIGFTGYGSTKPGDRVLLCVDSLYDRQVPDTIAAALREKGAKVDQIVVELEPDRELTELDEIEAMMRRGTWMEKPRRYEGIHWVEQLALREKYDLLVLGRGGPGPAFPPEFGGTYTTGAQRILRYEEIPWFDLNQLCSEYTTFPHDLHVLINWKLHEDGVLKSRGARIHVTDPEGTDISWTNFEEYYEAYYYANRGPALCHVMVHGMPPIVKHEDAEGVIAGTVNHIGRPFPTIKTYFEGGKLTRIDGGGQYGQAWEDMRIESDRTQYPVFPRPGLFWMWEVAIGTNPKVTPEPPHRIRYLSSGGVEKERARSGVVHFGIGSNWRTEEEQWAGPRGILHGHLHVHLMFATIDVTTTAGEQIRLIDNGHLTALDHPEVRELAKKYGDPDEILKESWIPKIPGITLPGSYDEYGRDPAGWIYSGRRDT